MTFSSLHRQLAAVLLGGVLAAGPLILAPAHAATGGNAGSAFDPSVQRIFASKSANTGDPTGLYELIPGSSSYSFTSIGGDANLVYNALTFNPDDNYLYAISGRPLNSGVPAGSLLKIGSAGNYEVVGTTQFTDPDNASLQIYLGAVDTDNDTFYVMNGDPGNPTQLIPVKFDGTSAGAPVPLSVTWNNVGRGSDLTYSNGFFWALGDTSLSRIDPNSGEVDTFSVPVGGDSAGGDQAGAAWTFGNGDLGFSYNNSGKVVRVAVTDPSSSTPTFAVVEAKSGSGSGQNDGAAIPGAPVAPGPVVACGASVGFATDNEGWRNQSFMKGQAAGLITAFGPASWVSNDGDPAAGSVEVDDGDNGWQELVSPVDVAPDHGSLVGKSLTFSYKYATSGQSVTNQVYVALRGNNGAAYYFKFLDQVGATGSWAKVTVPLTASQWVNSFSYNDGPTGTAPSDADFAAVLGNLKDLAISMEGSNVSNDKTLVDNLSVDCATDPTPKPDPTPTSDPTPSDSPTKHHHKKHHKKHHRDKGHDGGSTPKAIDSGVAGGGDLDAMAVAGLIAIASLVGSSAWRHGRL